MHVLTRILILVSLFFTIFRLFAKIDKLNNFKKII